MPTNVFAVGYFSDFADKVMVRFSDEVGRRYGAKGSVTDAAATICASQTRPSDSFWIVPGTAQ